MKYSFSDIVDIPKLNRLLEALYLATGIPSGVIDVQGNVLVAHGWRDICAKFHRVNKETITLCKESNRYVETYLKENQNRNEPYICYTCANGMVDAAAPIIIEGKHLANIFQGQFFFNEPDVEQFRLRAQKYGFDEEEYLAALAKVPIMMKEKLDSIMNYFLQLADMLAQTGLTKLRMLESKEKALLKSEKRFLTIINNTPNMAIQSFNEKGEVLFWNNASERIFGWSSSEVLGKKYLELDQINREEIAKISNALKKAKTSSKDSEPIEVTIIDKFGVEKNLIATSFSMDFSRGKKEIICMEIDITVRKKYEKEMQRYQQLNLIGEMAAGIGHEVRNPMTTVRGFLQILGEKEEDETKKEYFDLMITELDRANSIITEFLSLAKNKRIDLEYKNLNKVVEALAPLIQANAIVYNQQLLLELEETPDILLDEKEIRQLILNLARNGIEAMSNNGLLKIKTFRDNNEVVLTVQDNGPGIPPEIIENIGTPFISTKEKGTGMGIAICYNIATHHKALISFESTRQGTTFIVRFKI